MIRNIVFDMGKVLLDYDPVKVCWQYTDRAEDVELIDKVLFSAPEWVLLDKGVITEEEAMKVVRDRLKEDRLKRMVDLCLANWHVYNISPKAGMKELVKDLKKNGACIYLCSNASLRLRVFEQQIPGIEYFDGTLVSAEERLLKPDPAIYMRLFEKFGIRPEESFFIDDLAANIEGARKTGMDGHCFADGDVNSLREVLRGKGLLN